MNASTKTRQFRNELTGEVYEPREVLFVKAGHLRRDVSESERMVRICSSVWGGESWAPSTENQKVWVPVQDLA